MPSTVAEIIKFITIQLSEETTIDKSKSNIVEFLTQLNNSTKNNCIKLAVCIGIDIKTYSNRFTKQSTEYKNYCTALIDIINKCIENPLKDLLRGNPEFIEVEPSVNFGYHMNLNYTYFQPGIYDDKIEDSVRVVSLWNFVKWTLLSKNTLNINPTIIPSGTSTNQDNDNTDDILNQIIAKQIDISKISLQSLQSGSGWVFFTKEAEVIDEINDTNVPFVIDSLGWYIDGIDTKEHYIAIKYPPSFSEISYKPCALNGDWGGEKRTRKSFGNDFFITHYNEDSWGRTFSVSGTKPGVSERVHTNNAFLKKYDFSISVLGPLGVAINRCADCDILNNAIKRYDT